MTNPETPTAPTASHRIAYLYSYAGEPAKTQERVHFLNTTMYSNAPDGIAGNEDCGRISAWFILSAIGFLLC